MLLRQTDTELEQITFRVTPGLKDKAQHAVIDDKRHKRSLQFWLSPYVEAAIRAALAGHDPKLLAPKPRAKVRSRPQSRCSRG